MTPGTLAAAGAAPMADVRRARSGRRRRSFLNLNLYYCANKLSSIDHPQLLEIQGT